MKHLRQLALIVLLSTSIGVAGAQTTGAPLNLALPNVHAQNWNIPLNNNFTSINTSYGLLAPKASPTFTGTVTVGNIIINGSCTGSGCGGGGGAITSVFGRTGIVVAAANDYNFSQISGVIDLTSQVANVLPVVNGGSGSASPSLVAGTNITVTGLWPNQTITASATAATAFSALTTATNTVAIMTVGSGASILTSGTGTIAATSAPFTGLTGNLGIVQGPVLTGILKDAAGTLSVATAGTDYLLPTGSATGLSKASNTVFGVSECDGTTITCSGGIFVAVGGAVTSVFGRTGVVVQVSGDYSVAQVTGAAPLASPTFTGTPAAPTAAVNTNTTQLATTAFVLGQAANLVPTVDGTATIGTSLRYARLDHIHPTDTSRAPLASPTFTGIPAGPTASPGTNTTQFATTAFVIANATGLPDCTDTVGVSFVCTVPIGVTATGVPSQIDLTPTGTSPAPVAGAASLGVPNTVTTAGVYLLPAAPGSGIYTGTNSGGVVTTTFTGTTGGGVVVLATSPTLTAPILGAATATSLLATGTVDGKAGATITTGTTATLNAFLSGYWWNQEATAATAVAYTLPTAAAGLQKCVGNSWNGSAATTGILTVATSAAGQFIIFTSGALSATGGNVTSAGAAADAACFVGVDATHWQMNVVRGTWTLH